MVNKSEIIILSIFIFSLAFFLSFTVFPKNSLACHLAGPSTYYKDNQCTQPISAYDFYIDLGGCVIGYAAGPLYDYYCDGYSCYCIATEAKWYTSPSYNGQICKRRSGTFCDVGVKEGRWDSSDSRCVVCYGAYGVLEVGYFDCSGEYSGDWKCESACGADPLCDEKPADSSLPDFCGTIYLIVSRYCDASCKYSSTTYTCDSSHCGDVRSCGGQTYYCVYDNGWKWSTVKPINFCCSDNDCPAKNSIKGKCDSPPPYGTDNPDTLGYTYTCYWKPCKSDDECVSGTYCYCGACSPTFTSAGCLSGECCDRGYGGTGECVSKGTIRNIGSVSYLCDPPEWNSSNGKSEIKNESKSEKNIFESILSFFYSFFQR
jgi:hypothetical protein